MFTSIRALTPPKLRERSSILITAFLSVPTYPHPLLCATLISLELVFVISTP
jgi:hypothetical protein